MSKKAKKLYLELSHKIADLPDPPMCSEAGVRDWFFPEGLVPKRGVSTAAMQHQMRVMELSAKRICDFCPIKAQCAEYAIVAHEAHGVWGGTSPTDRKAIYASARANALGVTATPRLFD